MCRARGQGAVTDLAWGEARVGRLEAAQRELACGELTRSSGGAHAEIGGDRSRCGGGGAPVRLSSRPESRPLDEPAKGGNGGGARRDAVAARGAKLAHEAHAPQGGVPHGSGVRHADGVRRSGAAEGPSPRAPAPGRARGAVAARAGVQAVRGSAGPVLR